MEEWQAATGSGCPLLGKACGARDRSSNLRQDAHFAAVSLRSTAAAFGPDVPCARFARAGLRQDARVVAATLCSATVGFGLGVSSLRSRRTLSGCSGCSRRTLFGNCGVWS
jgi:hypothetical protein